MTEHKGFTMPERHGQVTVGLTGEIVTLDIAEVGTFGMYADSEVSRLYAENAALMEQLNAVTAVLHGYWQENEKLHARVKELETALETIVNIADDPAEFALDGATLAILTTARAALNT